MDVKLFTAAGSVGLASHIVLEEINLSTQLNYELVLLDMKNTEHRGNEYTKINPKARVPSLMVDGIVLTETPAILVYLAQLAPNASIGLPDDPMVFAQIQSFNSYLCSTVHIAHAHKYRGNRWVNDEAALAALTANVPNTMTECCENLEAHFIEGLWVFGEDYSVCDAYLFAISAWLEADGVNVSQFEKLSAHQQAMTERPAVQNALKQLGAG